MSNGELVRDLKRMIQRRGTLQELEDRGLEHGEFGLVEDIIGLYIGINEQLLKLLDESNIEDSLTSNDSNKVLSARQGFELKKQLEQLTQYSNNYFNDIVNELNTKQKLFVHEGSTPPSDTKMLWYKE